MSRLPPRVLLPSGERPAPTEAAAETGAGRSPPATSAPRHAVLEWMWKQRTGSGGRAGVTQFSPQVPERPVLVWCCEVFWQAKAAVKLLLLEGSSTTGQDSYNSQGSRSMQAAGSRFPSKSQATVSLRTVNRSRKMASSPQGSEHTALFQQGRGVVQAGQCRRESKCKPGGPCPATACRTLGIISIAGSFLTPGGQCG